MTKKIIFSVAIFLLSLLLFLLVTMPANFVWQRVLEPRVQLKDLGINILAVEGSIWDGRALFRYQQIEAIAAWQIIPSGLVKAKIPIELKLEGHAGEASLSAWVGLTESRIALTSADIDLEQFNSLLKRQRVELSGKVIVSDLVVDIAAKRIVSASGLFSWSGGRIAYPVAREVHERDFPSFKGKVEQQSDGLTWVGIRDAQATFDVISATLDQDGSAELQVRRRLLDLADEPWPSNSGEQDIIFKVKKALY